LNTNDRTGGSFIPDPSCFEITDAEFNKNFDIFCEITKDIALGKGGYCPTISLHYRKIVENGMPGDVESALVVIDEDFNDAEAKRKTLREIGRQAFSNHCVPVAVIMASEAWASFGTNDNPPDPGIPPSKDPNRKEIIGIAGRTLMGECRKGCIIPVGRDKYNNFVEDGEIIITSEVETYLLDEVLVGFQEALKQFLSK